MPLRRWLGLALMVVVAAALVAALPDRATAQKKVLNFAAKEPETLDPHTSILGHNQAIVRFLNTSA